MKQNRRVAGLLILSFITLVMLIANVFVVSIHGYHLFTKKNFKKDAQGIIVATDEIKAKRGTIYAQDNVIIATDVTTYNLAAILDESHLGFGDEPDYVKDKEMTASILAQQLGVSEAYIMERLNSDAYQVEFGSASRNLSLSQKEEIEKLALPGIVFTETVARQYPLGSFASNLVGIARYDDESKKTLGQMGFESLFNEELTGTNGSITYQKDVQGYIINKSTISEKKAIDGNDIYLTLDRSIQEQLENAFRSVKSEYENSSNFFGLVVEVETGKVLAISQDPYFNVNDVENSVFSNYLTDALIEPGSTFKAFTVAASLENGTYDGSALFDSNAFYAALDENGRLARADYNTGMGQVANALDRTWGYIPFDSAFKYSSNVGMGQLLIDMGEDAFSSQLERFMLTTPITTDRITTSVGTYQYNYPIEKLNVTFGQGVTITPLHMIQAYSAILNEGVMVKPYFIDRIVDGSGQVTYQAQTEVVGHPLSAQSAQKIVDLMNQCVVDEDGFCHKYQIENSHVIAKTGTAQIGGPQGYLDDLNIHSVMAALPYEDPKVMVYLGYQAPFDATYYDSKTGIKNLFKILAAKYDSKNANTPLSDVPQVSQQSVPNLVNHSLEYMESAVAGKGFEVVKIGNGQQIVAQAPNGNELTINNTRIMVLTDDANWLMPDMTGWSLKDVTNFWSLTNVEVVTKGKGSVVSQSVEIGQEISQESKIEVELK